MLVPTKASPVISAQLVQGPSLTPLASKVMTRVSPATPGVVVTRSSVLVPGKVPAPLT